MKCYLSYNSHCSNSIISRLSTPNSILAGPEYLRRSPTVWIYYLSKELLRAPQLGVLIRSSPLSSVFLNKCNSSKESAIEAVGSPRFTLSQSQHLHFARTGSHNSRRAILTMCIIQKIRWRCGDVSMEVLLCGLGKEACDSPREEIVNRTSSGCPGCPRTGPSGAGSSIRVRARWCVIPRNDSVIYADIEQHRSWPIALDTVSDVRKPVSEPSISKTSGTKGLHLG
jgi:hypothetical protein